VTPIGVDLTLAGVPGILWAPPEPAGPVPLVLLGHPGGLAAMRPRLAARAEQALAAGFAAATLELPGSGDRPRSAILEQARAELRQALQAGRPVSQDIVERLVLPLVDQAEPEWRTAVDELLDRPDVDGPVGWSGGVLALGVRMALTDPRITCAVLFAGSYVPRATEAEARQLTVPLHVLLQWDDAGNDRQQALNLFDAFGSTEKTLQANLGGHTGVPAFAGEEAHRFLARHLLVDQDTSSGRRASAKEL
jgi:dienelactone hydrolase